MTFSFFFKELSTELELIHDQAMGLLRFAVGMYFTLAVIHLFLLAPPSVAWAMSSIALFSSGMLFWASRHYSKPSAENTAMLHRIGAVIVSANALSHLYLDQNIMNSSMVMLVLMGFGAFILHRGLFLTATVLTIVIWLALVLHIAGWSEEAIHYSFGAVFSAIIGWFLMEHRRGLLQKLLLQQEQLQEVADVDWLTGCLRRHAFDRDSKRLFSQHLASECIVLFCDLDYFKRLNDHLGHEQGDLALSQVGALFMAFSQEHALLVGRVGGEEFVVAGLSSCSDGQRLAEELKCKVEALAIANPAADTGEFLTVSIGIACGKADPSTYSDLCRQADQALYAAKLAGRNRIQCAEHPVSP